MNLNTQIAEVLGWHVIDYEKLGWARNPDGFPEEIPNWQADMNACIRDLWPLLVEKGVTGINFKIIDGRVFCEIWNPESLHDEDEQEGETPAESFCKAWLEAMGGMI